MKFELTFQDIDNESIQQFEKEVTLSGVQYDKIERDSLEGFDTIMYFCSIGGGVAIIQIAKIIINFIKQNKNKSVKLNDIEIIGFSCPEVQKLLEKIKEMDL